MSFSRLRHPLSVLFFFFAATHLVRAQHVITGEVVDKKGAGIGYAGFILLHLPDSSIIQTSVADSNGNYRIEAAKITNTLLSATSPGYISSFHELKIETDANPIVNFTLDADAVELKTVSVSSRKPLIERKIDRTVFNVESSITAIGSDALEVIGKAPGVRVSGSDDITLAGKSTVSIMIDDKLIQLGGDELAEMLRSIPSDNISKIEVITTPPAKYDAAGNSGIINIVTRKTKKEGLNGNVNATYLQNTYGSLQPGMNFNYRKGKWNIYGNSNGGDNYSHPVERHTNYYTNQSWQQTDNIKNLYNYHRSQLGAEYNLTPNALISGLYTLGGSTPKRWDDVTGKWINANNEIDSIVITQAHTYDFGERHVGNLNYEWKIDSTGKKLNIDADFFTRAGCTVRDFTTIDMLGDGTLTGVNSDNKTTGKQVLYISSAKADMELPVRGAKVAFGAKASFIHVISDNVFQYLSNNVMITDTSRSNKFDYHENTQAIYASGQKKLNEKWDMQAGLRAEYTQTKALSVNTNQNNQRQYLKFFPTFYVQYTHNDDHVFNMNSSRRIERPNMLQINPFRRYTTPNSYDEGNPFLQPSFSSNFDVNYTLKSKYNFNVFTQHQEQIATQVLEVDTLTKGYRFRYANIGNSLNYGLTASATLQPTKWWECNIQLFAYHTSISANYYNTAIANKYSGNSFSAGSDNSFTLNSKKTILAEIGIEYTSKVIDNYDRQYPKANIDCGVKALLFAKKLVLGFNLNDIFATDVARVTNLYNGSTSNIYYDERSLHLNVTYKFGNKNVKSKREHNGGATEESKRA